ncbi:Myosin heavy-chain kinase [Mycoavidus cysteinexigens]|uniref:Myosin heavy-chain kinase n=1 Tax=Mycoavidus cysteinexigens TaxID=1553431 RepID=A0A2Z6EWK1_9BURK|nr:NACHT domain-containing protein [Mycoavidus cysteinexigens]BBE09782.1 Myosin heavy-chain kinase [Mycoavidus cysteinexigens]GLR01076.1 hypothetical protein GCM10007934_08880 [Mycoavidus cysteinexigens]
MLSISGSNVPHISNASTRSNLLTRVEAIHEQASGEGQTIVQASENCLVSNQASGDNNVFTTYIALTASDSNAKLVFEKLNGHAEAARYKPLAQLGTHIEELRTAYLNVLEEIDEVRDGLKLYIPSEGQETADSKIIFPLIDKVREFLSSSKKVLLLLGEAGSGKSTFNRHLTRMLWDEYQQSSTTPIPVFIALAEHTPSCKDLIESYLLEQEFSPEAITGLRKAKRLVFILDGFDEIQDRTQAFYTENKLDHWKNAQVIISSRPEYLGGNYRSQFQKRGQTSVLQEYWLSTISDDWITAYIQKYIQHTQRTGWNLKRYQDALNNLPTLKEAIRRPFLLRMALDLLPDLAESGSAPMTRIALYDEFISRWWNRSEERLLHITLTDEEKKARSKLGQHLVAKGLKASQEMAIALTQKHLVQAFYDPEKEEIIPKAWGKYFNEKDAEKRLLLFNAPLIHQGQHYRFIHKSIQEYLVARAICGPDFKVTESYPKDVINQLSLVKEPVILDFLVERVKERAQFKAYLHAWIEASKNPNISVMVGAANSMTVLVRAGIQFNSADLNGIRIPEADLSNGVFDSAQLQGADLRKVKFHTSWLRQANLRGAQMTDVQFGEWVYLQEESEVFSCTYSPDGKTCAMGFDNGVIRVHDTSNWATIHTSEGHTSRVMSVVYSPSGLQLASGSDDWTVRLWDAQSGAAVHTLKGHTRSVWSVVYSPSGLQLASGSVDGTVRLWDVESGASVHTLEGHIATVRSLVYSPSGAQLASHSNDKTVRLWDAKRGTAEHTLEGHTNIVTTVVYSPSGTQIASGSWDATVRLWDAESGVAVHTLEGHNSCVNSVAYSPSGAQLASGSDDDTVRLWDVESGAAAHTLEGHNEAISSVVYSPSGLQLASGSYDWTVCLWDAESGAAEYTLEGHLDAVRSLVYSPTGAQLASRSDDETVRLWDAKRGTAEHTLEGHTYPVSSVVYLPSGAQRASSSWDNTVRLWDAQSGAAVHILDGHTSIVKSVAYSPSGFRIASGSADKTVRLWDARSGAAERTLEGHTSAVISVAYSPSSTQLASGSADNTVRLWDAESGTAVRIIEGHTSGVRSVVYSPSGVQLASGSADKTVRLWDAQSGEAVRTLEGHAEVVTSVVYSPSGLQLASGSNDRTVRLWDVQSGVTVRTLRGHTGWIYSVVYSPSGSQLASGSYDKTVRLWDVKSGVAVRTLNHTDFVDSVAYSPSGSQLASVSSDKTVWLWEVVSGNCLKIIEDFSWQVSSIAWTVLNGQQYLATGGRDKSVRQWELKKEGSGYQAKLCWGNPRHEVLNLRNMQIEGVQSLSERNVRLLKQRGAIEEMRGLSVENEELLKPHWALTGDVIEQSKSFIKRGLKKVLKSK